MNYTKGKVVFVGNTGVGKTSIIYKYLRNNTPVIPTVAGNSMPIEVQLDNVNVVKLNVWDTSGSENYQCLVPMYARTSQVAIVVFDVTEEKSFEDVEEWLKYLNTNSNTPNIFLVGNKTDCDETFKDCYYEAIKCFHYEIADYIKKNKFSEQNDEKYYESIIKNSNYSLFTADLCKRKKIICVILQV